MRRQRQEATRAAGGFVRHARLDSTAGTGRYPFTLPVVQYLARAGGLEFEEPVTFLVGDNGTGKSTLIEGLAVAAGFNAEGGSQSFRFATRATESSLGDHLVLRWGRKPRTGFFLRAESFYNVATEIERLDGDPDSPPLLPAYGGVSPHERSRGESFLDVVIHCFGPDGLYLLDEPEAALSVRGVWRWSGASGTWWSRDRSLSWPRTRRSCLPRRTPGSCRSTPMAPSSRSAMTTPSR